jgi:3-oxoacyl-[acyl-carrier protein] reductase
LAADGAHVWVGYARHREAAEEVVAEIRGAGGSAEAVSLDVSHEGEAEAVCGAVFAASGRLDILANCAALNREAPALGMENEDWDAVLDVNLSGAFELARAAARYMLLGRWGRIINVSSVSATRGGRGQINYAASKAGMESMTRVLALELGRKGILANCVAPGVIETAMSERIRAEHGDRLLEQVAVRRFGKPEEVAEVVSFLASERSSYISGQVIRVDGGLAL